MKIFAEIPARGGSKGVPGKALKDLGGKPVIAWTIEHALSIESVSKVFVNTDCPDIRAVAIQYGAEVPFLRPKEMAGDESPLFDAVTYSSQWYHDNQKFDPDIYILMSPTYPFRRPGLLNDALKKCFEEPDIFNLSSVSHAKVPQENYRIIKNGVTEVFDYQTYPDEIPDYFYQSAMSFNIVLNTRTFCQNCRVPFVLNEIEAVDIDEQKDLELARLVIEEELFPFEEL